MAVMKKMKGKFQDALAFIFPRIGMIKPIRNHLFKKHGITFTYIEDGWIEVTSKDTDHSTLFVPKSEKEKLYAGVCMALCTNPVVYFLLG